MKYFFMIVAGCLLLVAGYGQPLNKKEKFTRQDTLRGSIGSGRDWWDVLKYEILVTPDYTSKAIRGITKIIFKPKKVKDDFKFLSLAVQAKSISMQIDLQEPLIIDSVIHNQPYLVGSHSKARWEDAIPSKIDFVREGNVYFLDIAALVYAWQKIDSIMIYYHGKPREAITPPWDGGWIWTMDAKGNPWMSVACQGLGASVWYPCKDHQSDEPDFGASLAITVPDSLSAVGNGNLISKRSNNNGTSTWTWEVKNPINNYNIIPYIGKYTNWTDTFNGEKGKLNCSYWVMDYNVEKAKKQFGRDVHPMLKAFEYWMGPYPFYEDGYKLVESPHLGMEHQSATAYGNQYVNGYLGGDLSGTGWGLKWDFIIIHESGHEWFANNITSNELADMWLHEGFTAYSETLFTEYYYGKEAATDYVIGTRREILNDKPVIGHYGVNQEGSDDMYYKGSNLLHTIRQVINNDSLFRQILRGLNKTFYHQTVTTRQVENYISKMAKKDFSKVFDQYLRTAKIPVLEYKIESRGISYRWTNCVKGFAMPVKISLGNGRKDIWITPSGTWQHMNRPAWFKKEVFNPDRNFLITYKKV